MLTTHGVLASCGMHDACLQIHWLCLTQHSISRAIVQNGPPHAAGQATAWCVSTLRIYSHTDSCGAKPCVCLQVQELEALLLSSQRPHEAFDQLLATTGPTQRGQLDDAWHGAHSALVSKMDSSEVSAPSTAAAGLAVRIKQCISATAGQAKLRAGLTQMLCGLLS